MNYPTSQFKMTTSNPADQHSNAEDQHRNLADQRCCTVPSLPPSPSVSTPSLCLLFVALLWAPALQAQTPAAPQDKPVALAGGAIHTVSDGVVEGGTLLFENGVITAVGTGVELPAGTQVVDVTGKQIYPGLIDAYSQMGLYEIGMVEMTLDLVEQGHINPNVRAEVAFNPESRHIGVARSGGVLVTVSSPSGGLVSGQSAAMMLDGWTWEDMIVKPATGLIVNWPAAGDEENYEKQLRGLRDLFEEARAYRTARRADEVGQVRRHDYDIRLEALIPVLDGEVPVVAAANEVRQIQDAVTWAQEENLRLVILGGRDAGYVSNHLARKEIPVIITTVLASPNRMWEPYDSRYSLPVRLSGAGVRFAIAGAAGAANTDRLPYEAGAAAAYGLPEEEALRSITLSPAEILGFDDRLGSLAPGRDATLLITDGNPLEYSTQIEQAYIEGRKIDMTDSHRRFYEKYREKVRQRAEAAGDGS